MPLYCGRLNAAAVLFRCVLSLLLLLLLAVVTITIQRQRTLSSSSSHTLLCGRAYAVGAKLRLLSPTHGRQIKEVGYTGTLNHQSLADSTPPSRDYLPIEALDTLHCFLLLLYIKTTANEVSDICPTSSLRVRRPLLSRAIVCCTK